MTAMNLNTEEKRLVDALRKFRRDERKGPRPVPAALLDHGYVSKAQAARLLGVTLEEVDAMKTPWGRHGLDESLPTFAAGIPISALRSAWEDRERTRLRSEAEKVICLVKTRYVSSWVANRVAFISRAFREDLYSYSVRDVATELRLNLKDAQSLMDAPDGLACWGRHRVEMRCSRYELEAMKRKRSIPGAVGYPSSSRRVWENVEALADRRRARDAKSNSTKRDAKSRQVNAA